MKYMKVKSKIAFYGLVVLVGVFVYSLVGSSSVNAAAVTGFKPGRIMDDATFTKKGSMSAAQIQSFLNSKVPSCDTNGTKTSEYGGGTRAQYGKSRGYPPPYTCLRNYSQNGKSAAQIIYNAAQEFNINPQVLIVLLQKEQGLVTDTWPWSIQYRSATGYGCPDTAACNSDYYGFTNQVRWSARMFRAILNKSNTWYTPYGLGNNKIYWNPDTGRCGSSTVNIENLTTVALYSYTPYRPNQAALNAGYGTGDSCSSYGNRNFYQYFKDWFGSPFATYAAAVSDIQIHTNSSRTTEVESIPELRTGQSVYLTVKAKNTGSYTWERANVRIGTTNPNNRSSSFADTSWLSSGRPAQLVESSVAPGSIGTFRFSVTAPTVDGSYAEKFGLLAEGKAWMSDNASFTLNLPVVNPYNATITSIGNHSDNARSKPIGFRVKAGSTTYWRVSAKNIGKNAWSQSITKLGTSSPNDRISTLSNNSWLSGSRVTQLSQPSVAKGATGTFDFQIAAPSTEKKSTEAFAIVAEGQSWMPNSKFSINLRTVNNPARLNNGQTLYAGEQVYTPNGYRLSMQQNGNLVLYNPSGKGIWGTSTSGSGNRLVHGFDGILRIYTSSNKQVWSSRTSNAGTKSRLILQNDGKLVLWSTSNKIIWSKK